MAAGSFQLYNTGKESLLTDNANQITWATDTVVAVLLGTSYTPSASHVTYADISAHIITDPDYTPAVVTGKTSVLTVDKILWDCDNVSFGDPVSLTAKYVAFVKLAAGALAGTDRLIGHGDLNVGVGLTASSTNSVFQVNTTNGLFDV